MRVIVVFLICMIMGFVVKALPIYLIYGEINTYYLMFFIPYSILFVYVVLIFMFSKTYYMKKSVRVGIRICYVIIFGMFLVWNWYYGDYIGRQELDRNQFVRDLYLRSTEPQDIHMKFMYQERVKENIEEELIIGIQALDGEEYRLRVNSRGVNVDPGIYVDSGIRYSDILKRKSFALFEDVRMHFSGIMVAFYVDAFFSRQYNNIYMKFLLFFSNALLFSSGILLIGMVRGRFIAVFSMLTWGALVSILLLIGLSTGYLFIGISLVFSIAISVIKKIIYSRYTDRSETVIS